MDFYRRLHQSSYPPRPSPLGTSESRDERSRTFTSAATAATAASATPDPRRPEIQDKGRPTSRYEQPIATSNLSFPTSRVSGSHPLRESTSAHVSPVKSHPGQHQQHRRHASLEGRHHYTHRRNHSQPQVGQNREGRRQINFLYSFLFLLLLLHSILFYFYLLLFYTPIFVILSLCIAMVSFFWVCYYQSSPACVCVYFAPDSQEHGSRGSVSPLQKDPGLNLGRKDREEIGSIFDRTKMIEVCVSRVASHFE